MPTTAILHDQPRTTSSGRQPADRSGRLRVCHLSMTLNTGGLERLLVDIGRFHDDAQFELSFVALDELGPPARELQKLGHPVFTVDLQRQGKLRAFSELTKILESRRIDLLHTHNTYAGFYGSLAARWAKVPAVINTQHGRGCGQGTKLRWQFRIANQLTDRIVGVSEDATGLCRSQDPPRARKMQCIWNGIDLDRFDFHGPRLEPIAISVARLSPEKNYETLLQAVRLVVDRVPEFRLKLVGDGSERSRLETLTKELGIGEHVEFLGERQDIPALLRTAGFFVSSSKTEGISLTLLEAMAVGLPIVTTRVGGNPEIVVPGETGKLVPPLDPAGLAAAMLEMLDEQSRWPEMARAARDRVERNFNIREMVRHYEELYQDILARQQARSIT